MKKITSILLAVLVVFSMFTFVASAAVTAPTIKATANVSTANVGDTVKVTVSTSANSKMCAVTLSLNYNPEYFEVTGKTSEEAFSLEEFGESAGKVKFVATANSTVKDAATTLFTVDFKVLKAGGKIDFVADEVYVADNNGTPEDKEDDKDVNVTADVKGNTISFGCAHANTEATVTKAPTCTEAGTKTITCKDCGEKVKDETVAPTDHKFADSKVVKEATCTEKGLEEGTCTECGTVTQKEIPAKGHDYEAKVVKEATCEEAGLEEGTCKNCDAKVKKELPKKNHKYGDWKVVTPATATKDGVKERTCANCGKVDKGVIPKKGSSSADLGDPNTGASLSFAFAAAGLALATGTVVRRKRSK